MEKYNINVEDMIHSYFQKPTLKTISITPEIEQQFNNLKTKRDKNKCFKYIQKLNDNYLKIHTKEYNTYESIKNILNHIIDNYPYEISKLFIESIQMSMDEHIELVTKYHECNNKIKTFFTLNTSTESYYLKVNIMAILQFSNFNKIYYKYYKNNKCEGLKNDILNLKSEFTNTSPYKEKDIAFINSKTDEEWYSFIKLLKEYYDVRRYYATVNGKTNAEMFKLFVYKIDTISKNINKIIGGYPDGVETDVHWGLNNVFNGIIYRNPTTENGTKIRASFKSFIAGGHNIQCRHIRVRVTILK